MEARRWNKCWYRKPWCFLILIVPPWRKSISSLIRLVTVHRASWISLSELSESGDPWPEVCTQSKTTTFPQFPWICQCWAGLVEWPPWQQLWESPAPPCLWNRDYLVPRYESPDSDSEARPLRWYTNSSETFKVQGSETEGTLSSKHIYTHYRQLPPASCRVSPSSQ